MAASPFQPLPNLPDQLYNLTTDPPSYPLFTSFDERGEYIRDELEGDYFNRLERQVRRDIQAIPNIDTWAEPQFREWARKNNLPDNIEYRLSPPGPDDDDSMESGTESEEDWMDEELEGDSFDRSSYNFRQVPHLPMPLRLRFLTQAPPLHSDPAPRSPRSRAGHEASSASLRGSPRLGLFSDSDEQAPYQGRSGERSRSPLRRSAGLERRGGSPEYSLEPPPRGLSRERSRSPSRRSQGLERRGDSPDGSPGRRGRRGDSLQSSLGRRARRGESPGSSPGRRATRQEFLEVDGERRSRSNSPQRIGSPGRWAGSSSDSRESSPRERAATIWFDAQESSGESPGESRWNSSQGSDSPVRGARSGSGSPERSPRGNRTNSPQGSGSPGTNAAAPLLPDDEDENSDYIKMPTLKQLREREIEKRMKPWMEKFYNSFVGEQAHPAVDGSRAGFGPRRGDLIISHPGSRHIGLPNSVGYIASYLGESYNFTPRHLVLRVGNFDVIPGSAVFQGLIFYKPFTSLELYAYRRKSVKSSWRFLGHQAQLHNPFDFRNEPDVSPGKFLMVGTPVLGSSSNFVQALMPRRGDIIIKREVWAEGFSHPENFWYSMVKWHRGRQFSFLPGDMLVRRLVDNDARNQRWGWAELYQYEGISVGWVFWGRTQHVYDTRWPEREHCILLYEYDHGVDSDDEIRKERVNPR